MGIAPYNTQTPSRTESRIDIIESILQADINCIRRDKSVKIDPVDVMRVLAEVATKRRVSFTELLTVVGVRRGEKTAEVVRLCVEILRRRRRWIDAIDSPVPELTIYYMTAEGLAALDS